MGYGPRGVITGDRRRRGSGGVIAALTIGFAVCGVVAVTAAAPSGPPPPTGVIQACRLPGSGVLRVIDPNQMCRPGEAPLSWNQQGAAGRAPTEAQIAITSGASPFVMFRCPTTGYRDFGGCPGDRVDNLDFTVDPNQYPSPLSGFLDVHLSAAPGSEFCVRLFDRTAGAAVAGSEACTTERAGKAFVGPFLLATEVHEYTLQGRWEGRPPTTTTSVIGGPSTTVPAATSVGGLSVARLHLRW